MAYGAACFEVREPSLDTCLLVDGVEEILRRGVIGLPSNEIEHFLFCGLCYICHCNLLSDCTRLVQAGSMSDQLRPSFTSTFNGTSSLSEAGMISFTRPRSSSS